MTDNKPALLVIEDDEGLQRQLRWAYDDYEVLIAGDRATALAILRERHPAVVTLDLGLPPDADGTSEGFATLEEIMVIAPHTRVIVASGHGARDNARRAGVDDCIAFAVADAREFAQTTDRGVIVTNPPYGERLMEKREAEALYTAFGSAYAKTEHWRLYLLSSHTEFERAFGRPADKKRKLYNGTLRCDLFQYTKDV